MIEGIWGVAQVLAGIVVMLFFGSLLLAFIFAIFSAVIDRLMD